MTDMNVYFKMKMELKNVDHEFEKKIDELLKEIRKNKSKKIKIRKEKVK